MSTRAYSSCKNMSEAIDLAVKKGWRHEYGGKHGKVFTPCGRMWITHSSTPSDHNAYKQFIRSVAKLSTTLNIENPFKEIKPEQERVEMYAHKQLDNEALETIKKLRLQGKNYEECAEVVYAQGYRTGPGKRYDKADISRFMCARGYRTNSSSKRPNRTAKDAKQEPAAGTVVHTAQSTNTQAKDILHEVSDIITSSLSDDTKKKVLKLILAEARV